MNQDTLDGPMTMENTKQEERDDHGLLFMWAMLKHFPILH